MGNSFSGKTLVSKISYRVSITLFPVEILSRDKKIHYPDEICGKPFTRSDWSSRISVSSYMNMR